MHHSCYCLHSNSLISSVWSILKWSNYKWNRNDRRACFNFCPAEKREGSLPIGNYVLISRSPNHMCQCFAFEFWRSRISYDFIRFHCQFVWLSTPRGLKSELGSRHLFYIPHVTRFLKWFPKIFSHWQWNRLIYLHRDTEQLHFV